MILDQDAMFAAIDLVGRSGARHVEFGHLHEDVPIEDASWWATATYMGAKLTVENHRGPVDALEALARRILDGGVCTRCRQPIRLDDQLALSTCRWTRQGARWVRSCEATEATTT